MMCISKFRLFDWGEVVASATVSQNSYYSPTDKEEPRYILEGVEVWRGKERIDSRLNLMEQEVVEEMLCASFEASQDGQLAYLADLETDTMRLAA